MGCRKAKTNKFTHIHMHIKWFTVLNWLRGYVYALSGRINENTQEHSPCAGWGLLWRDFWCERNMRAENEKFCLRVEAYGRREHASRSRRRQDVSAFSAAHWIVVLYFDVVVFAVLGYFGCSTYFLFLFRFFKTFMPSILASFLWYTILATV